MLQSSSTTTGDIPNNSAPSNITIPHVPPTQQTPLLPSSILNGILMEKQKLESKINEFMDMLQNHNWDDFMKTEEKVGKMMTNATSKMQSICDTTYNDVKKSLSAKSDEEMELFRALLKSELHEKKREYRAWLADENTQQQHNIQQYFEKALKDFHQNTQNVQSVHPLFPDAATKFTPTKS